MRPPSHHIARAVPNILFLVAVVLFALYLWSCMT